MNKYKAVIFDLDGTLLDTSEGIVKSTRYTIDALGFPPLSMERLLAFIGPPVKRSFQATFHLSEEEAIRAMNMFREHYSAHDLYSAKVYDGIFDLLKYLQEHQIKIGVATYKREDYAADLLAHFNIAGYCDSIKGADKEGRYTKSDIVRNCMESLEAAPRHTVLIGDSDNDAIGAKEAGIDFIGVTYGFGFQNERDFQGLDKIGIAFSPYEIKKYI